MNLKSLRCVCFALAMLSLTIQPAKALPLEVLDGIVRGEGSHRKLIYDPNSDVTWLDGRLHSDWTTVQAQAATMQIVFNDELIDGWKIASPSDYLSVYAEFGNVPGQVPNDGPFTLFLPLGYDFYPESTVLPYAGYWTDTETSAEYARFFDFPNGVITGDRKGTSDVEWAMAVHPGRVGVPDAGATAILLAVGLAGLGTVRRATPSAK